MSAGGVGGAILPLSPLCLLLALVSLLARASIFTGWQELSCLPGVIPIGRTPPHVIPIGGTIWVACLVS